MDINVRFWNKEANEISTRYLTSVFLGSSTALDILEAFKAGIHSLDKKKILQVSMDGPNVNHKFLMELKAELKSEPGDKTILDLGSCGLHTLHCAFKSAMLETGWNIVPFMRALYNLFKDSPARRAMYTKVTMSTVFPKKFCAVRWLENVGVAQRSLDMLPNIKLFVEEVKANKTIDTFSFRVVSNQVKDPLLPAKLEFFKCLACELEPLLRQFQSDCPLAPFLYNDISSLIRTQMDRVVLPKAMEESKSVAHVNMVEKYLLSAKQVDIGIATKNALKKAQGHKKIKDVNILKFRDGCRKALVKFVTKILEKSPLHFKLTKAISCFDPKVAVNFKVAKLRLEQLLTTLLDNNWVTSSDVDKILRQYISLCSQPQVIEKLNNYTRKVRLDHFWGKLLADNDSETLANVMRLVMTLSHGNANVERGFSVNAECIVENMREELLVARRCVYDTVLSIGGLQNLVIEKLLIHAARNTSSRYKEAAQEKKKSIDDKGPKEKDNIFSPERAETKEDENPRGCSKTSRISQRRN